MSNQKDDQVIDLSALTPAQKQELLRRLSEESRQENRRRREAYEALRLEFLYSVHDRLTRYMEDGRMFKEWLRGETESWFTVMKEYGQLKNGDNQLGFAISDGTFKMNVKGNKVKKFDERADVAEKRLVDFLNAWVARSEKGVSDPMYKLAMLMIQRNEAGELDYKSISRLYELEGDFADPEYSSIMQLFKESNVVEGTAINFYLKF
jgi:hypothetical protein